MAKRTAAVWMDQELYERIQRLATVDRRSVSEIILMAVERGLPALEEELIHKLNATMFSLNDSVLLSALRSKIQKPTDSVMPGPSEPKARKSRKPNPRPLTGKEF